FLWHVGAFSASCGVLSRLVSPAVGLFPLWRAHTPLASASRRSGLCLSWLVLGRWTLSREPALRLNRIRPSLSPCCGGFCCFCAALGGSPFFPPWVLEAAGGPGGSLPAARLVLACLMGMWRCGPLARYRLRSSSSRPLGLGVSRCSSSLQFRGLWPSAVRCRTRITATACTTSSRNFSGSFSLTASARFLAPRAIAAAASSFS